jgi:ABC-2 type transport system ATP-binding protein
MSRHPKPPNSTSASAPSSAQKAPVLPAALIATNVAKDYGDGPALYPLSVRVEEHERVALIGHNGSGKTTFLRIATGLLEPASGGITIFGQEPGSMVARSKLSYLADTPTFYDDLSVWEHLEYTARLHNMTAWEQRAADLLGQLGIYERGDDLPSRFSRGLKQKAAIAIAFIRPFELMLVDEPFVGLDADGKEALLDLFDQASTAGAALVVATHELSFVSRTARTIALRDGALIFDGESSQAQARGLVAVEGTTTQD